MSFLYIFLGLFLFFAIASAQAGFSMKFFDNRLQNWQNKIPLGNRIPEFSIALVFGCIALWGWDNRLGLVEQYITAHPITSVALLFIAAGVFFGLLLVAGAIAFFGKESATVFYLPGNWEGWSKDSNEDGVITEEDARNSTMRFFNDFIAKILRVSVVGPVYPKIWAFTKGLLISIPICGLCAPFHPITRHIAIHLGRWVNNRTDKAGGVNFYAEFVGDGLSYASGATLFLYLVTHI